MGLLTCLNLLNLILLTHLRASKYRMFGNQLNTNSFKIRKNLMLKKDTGVLNDKNVPGKIPFVSHTHIVTYSFTTHSLIRPKESNGKSHVDA